MSTRTHQVVDFVVDASESERANTMKHNRDFPYIPKHPQLNNNYRDLNTWLSYIHSRLITVIVLLFRWEHKRS